MYIVFLGITIVKKVNCSGMGIHGSHLKNRVLGRPLAVFALKRKKHR